MACACANFDCKDAIMSTSTRQLTDSQLFKLNQDSICISEYKRDKIERESMKHWDLFYKHNFDHFFKDRHWCIKEFSELLYVREDGEHIKLLECGCGVGNFINPLLKETDNLYIYGCDFSYLAININMNNKDYDTKRCKFFHCDLTIVGSLIRYFGHQKVEIATLIFVLSAISPDKIDIVIQNIRSILSDNGCILFRDYGLHDYAMLKFKPGHKISNHFYYRHDWTRVYYFSIEETNNLFMKNGFEIIENRYVHKKTVNKKLELNEERIFVQGRYYKKNCNISNN